MSWLSGIWLWLRSWFGSWLPNKGRGRLYRAVVAQESLPRTLDRQTLYLVEDDGYLEQAAMLCPCGCGSTLNMNLLPDERPCWSVTQQASGTVSLHPSVWRKVVSLRWRPPCSDEAWP